MSKVNREKGYCYHSNVEELRKRITFVLLFFLRERRNIIPSIFANLGPGHPQCFSFKNAVGLWGRDEKRMCWWKQQTYQKHFFDFWNRKSPLCTLFYEIQTCQVCVFIQKGYKLHFSGNVFSSIFRRLWP